MRESAASSPPISSPDLLLLTIPFSHFCEKARWALERAGLSFDEEMHLPLFSRRRARALCGRDQVPVLVAKGETLSDSTDILHWVDRQRLVAPLFPADPAQRAEVMAWEERFDKVLGPDARRLIYGSLFTEPGRLKKLLTRNVPQHEALFAKLFAPLLIRIIKRGLKIDGPGVARSRQRLDQLFSDLEVLLADGRTYLVGDTFTAADLSLAALASPILWPAHLEPYLGALEEAPRAAQEVVALYRSTKAGAFALKLYEQR